MTRITPKEYKCRRCGAVRVQKTNHHGPTYSFGHANTCPECPPWAKYPEYGGHTTWDCLEALEDLSAIKKDLCH